VAHLIRRRQELGQRALRRNLAILHHDDVIGASQRLPTVGDGQDGYAAPH
jgi:hypothetical protein